MPSKVSNVRWKCPQCGKSFWLKPSIAKAKKFCSRKCYYKSQVVENPVRAKRANVVVRYGWRKCEQCDADYEAKTVPQRFCSQACATKAIQDRRRTVTMTARPCEYCDKLFTPRNGSAGRFCCFEHKNLGQRGEKASFWKGGRHKTSQGYIRVYAPNHPRAQGHGGYVAEHHIVMEKKLGRYLEAHETVHHEDGNRQNNDPDNLQLRSGRHGKGVAHHCADCGSTNIVTTEI